MNGIRRLAAELNLSTATVSRALNDRPGASLETRQRVLRAAADLGYAPNHSGRSLRQGSTKAIGFMIELTGDVNFNSDNFFLSVFDGVQETLGRHGLDLVALPCPTDEDPADYLHRMVARGLVDAMIISATHRKDGRIDLLKRAKIPFVALGRSATPGPYPWIDLDFEGVAGRAVDRLVANGHRRIALALPGNDINLGFVFHDGYRAALARHNIDYDADLIVRVQSSELGGYQLGQELLTMAEPPTAVVLIYELMAIGLYRRLDEAGLAPGRDLSVIGFRESPLAQFLLPRLTCFRTSLRDLGISLGEALLAAMPAYAEQYPQGVVNKIWPMELVSGESDGPASLS